MSNFFDDYLKINPVKDNKDDVKEKPKEDEQIDGEGGTDENDE